MTRLGCVSARAADADDRLDDDRDHGRRQAEEEPVEEVGVAVLDVDRRQRQQGQHPRQHEEDAGDDPAAESR